MYTKQDSIVEIRNGEVGSNDVYNYIKCFLQNTELSDVPIKWRKDVRQIGADIGSGQLEEKNAQFRMWEKSRNEIKQLSKNELIRYIVYRYRYNAYPRQRVLSDFPPCLQIEPSSICNYRCIFCYQTDLFFTKRKNGYMGTMSLDLFKSLIDQAEGNCEAITLASRGEPLICKEIESMLAYCRDKFLGLKMNTNACFLDERKTHAVLSSGMDILVFSVESTTYDSYRSFRVGGNFGRILDNIRRFQEIRLKHYPGSKIVTRVSGVKYSDDQDLDAMENFWGDLVDQVAFVKYNPWENVYINPVNDITTPCSDLHRRMFVWFDGTINPCDVDYRSKLTIGNAYQTPLNDIWLSEAYNTLRKAHIEGNRYRVTPCNRCKFV